jgi:hypothetical protein
MNQQSQDKTFISPDDPLAVSATNLIKASDFKALSALLQENPGLATAYIGTPTEARTLLHIVTDWPGKLPYGSGMIHIIAMAGGDVNVNAPFIGAQHQETPLHWAASCDDTSAINALLDQGADVEATGGVIANGTPLTDAVAFRQWNAARRLLDYGHAKPNLNSAAALGLLDHLEKALRYDDSTDDGEKPSQQDLDYAFWYACHGGQLKAARFLHARGADSHVTPPWSEGGTGLDAAKEYEGSDMTTESELVAWLRSIGVTSNRK